MITNDFKIVMDVIRNYQRIHNKPTLGWGSPTIEQYLTIKICDKILQNIARRFDVSRTSLSSENKIMKSSKYNEEMNKLKKKALKVKQRVWP